MDTLFFKKTDILAHNENIAIYMGATKQVYIKNEYYLYEDGPTDDSNSYSLEDMDYPLDWNWQVPVFGNLIQDYNILTTESSIKDTLHDMQGDYFIAIVDDNKLLGYAVIIEMIRILNLLQDDITTKYVYYSPPDLIDCEFFK